jgi:pheromone shutdown protein TraB
MLSVLSDILHGVLDIPYLIVNLLIESFNGWILILSGLLAVVLAILPGFPEVPTLDGEVLSGVAWFLPIAPMLAIFATFVTAWVLWMGYSVILRWVKALG